MQVVQRGEGRVRGGGVEREQPQSVMADGERSGQTPGNRKCSDRLQGRSLPHRGRQTGRDIFKGVLSA